MGPIAKSNLEASQIEYNRRIKIPEIVQIRLYLNHDYLRDKFDWLLNGYTPSSSKKLACEVLLSAIYDYRAGPKPARGKTGEENDYDSAVTFIFSDSQHATEIREFWCRIAEISVHNLRRGAKRK